MSVPPDIKWELIIVDNNSTDNLREVVQDFTQKSKLNVRYLFEGKPGLSHARNKGIGEARGNYIAFTDDDCIVDRPWLISILEEFDSDPDLSGLGGRAELYNTEDKPVSIRTSRERHLFVSHNQLFNLIPGCNMAFRRKVFDAVGNFDPDFGAGARIPSAEDTDFYYRVYKTGLKLLYSPDILIYHNHGRCTDEQVQALKRGYLIGRGALYCKYILRGDGIILKMALRENFWRIINLLKNSFRGKSIIKEIKYTYYLLLGVKYELRAISRHKTL